MLGAIADDVTGAVDLASNLVSRGFRTRLLFGVPSDALSRDADAIVIALKSRTAPVDRAVADSVASLAALRSAGAECVYIKYCSTFDSTPRGNIGPVCDAVADELGAGLAVVVPSFPANGRTLYRGHLFVGDVLLSESPLAHHPLTPMTDPDIVRVLGRQTTRPVALVPLEVVRAGERAVAAALDAREAEGARYAVVDAVADEDLRVIAAATAGRQLVTGGSGLALGMTGPSPGAACAAPRSTTRGPRVVLAGSASAATRSQLRYAIEASVPVLHLRLGELETSAEDAFAEARRVFRADSDALVVIAPEETSSPVDATTAEGARRAEALERTFGELARRFVEAGVRRFIVAGGETSGAVVTALGVRDLVLGAPIDPGVAWTFTSSAGADGDISIALALKSGNFASREVFIDAWRHLT